MNILRKARGMIGIGVIWAVLWALIFAALAAIASFVEPASVSAGEGPIDVWPIGAGVGLVAGVSFAVILAAAENGRRIHNLSLSRAAIWGFLASAIFPLSTGRQSMVLLLCPVGAAIAVALVEIARKAIARQTTKI